MSDGDGDRDPLAVLRKAMALAEQSAAIGAKRGKSADLTSRRAGSSGACRRRHRSRMRRWRC